MLPKNVKYISTTRYVEGGASVDVYGNFNLATHVGDRLDAVNANRELLVQHFNLPAMPKWLVQTHSDICLDATSADCEGDAVVACQTGVVCAVLTADCLPIFASNLSGTQVGVAHAGWQGIVAGVIEAFVAKFDNTDVQLHFGPAMSQCAFEVGAEVYQQFVEKDSALSAAFVKQGKKYRLDIYQAARIVLHGLGIDSISGGQACTFSQVSDYFSYRRDGVKSGRMAHLIWIK